MDAIQEFLEDFSQKNFRKTFGRISEAAYRKCLKKTGLTFEKKKVQKEFLYGISGKTSDDTSVKFPKLFLTELQETSRKLPEDLMQEFSEPEELFIRISGRFPVESSERMFEETTGRLTEELLVVFSEELLKNSRSNS